MKGSIAPWTTTNWLNLVEKLCYRPPSSSEKAQKETELKGQLHNIPKVVVDLKTPFFTWVLLSPLVLIIVCMNKVWIQQATLEFSPLHPINVFRSIWGLCFKTSPWGRPSRKCLAPHFLRSKFGHGLCLGCTSHRMMQIWGVHLR